MESTLGKSLINVLNTEFVKNWAPTNIVKYLTVLVANNLYGLNYTSFDQQDSEGYTLLHHATLHKDTNIMDLLIKYGINIDAAKKGQFFQIDGPTALHLAIENNLVSELKLLMNSHADLEAEYHHRTPLQLAALNNNTEMTNLLLQYNVDVNADTIFYDNIKAIHLAAYNNNYEMVSLLINAKSEVFPKTKSNEIPLSLTTSKDVAKLLIEKGPDKEIYKPDPKFFGRTVIYYTFENLEVTKLLVEEYKINFKIKDNHGYTPLHFACLNGNKDVADYLISLGLSVEEKNDESITPQNFAQEYFTKHADSSYQELCGVLRETSTIEATLEGA